MIAKLLLFNLFGINVIHKTSLNTFMRNSIGTTTMKNIQQLGDGHYIMHGTYIESKKYFNGIMTFNNSPHNNHYYYDIYYKNNDTVFEYLINKYDRLDIPKDIYQINIYVSLFHNKNNYHIIFDDAFHISNYKENEDAKLFEIFLDKN